jgi:hypothetical protein
MPATGDKEQKPVTDEQKSIFRKSREWFKGVPSVWKGVGAVVSTVATILSIWSWLFPPSSSETWAQITTLREGPHISLEEFIQRPGVDAEARTDAETILSAEQRDRVGSVAFFDVEATGYEGEPIHVRWSVYEANPGKAISDLTNQTAWPNPSIEPKSERRI